MNDLDSLQRLDTEVLSCEEPRPWADGEKILGYLREVEHVGLTGEIKFDDEGYRTHFNLELLEKLRYKSKTIQIKT